MKEQINEQLSLLEKELSRLGNVTDYIDKTNKSAKDIITELEEIQNKYSEHIDRLYDLYQQSINEVKKDAKLQIKESVVQFETVGDQIDETNREKLAETKKLLSKYKKIVEATDDLVQTLNAVDFPSRLDTIENKMDKSLESLNERFNQQEENNKSLKVILYVLIGLTVILGVANLIL